MRVYLMVRINQMWRCRDRETQSISCTCGARSGFGIYHHCNSAQAADKKVPLILSLSFGTSSKSPSRPFTWVISNAALGTTIPFKAHSIHKSLLTANLTS